MVEFTQANRQLSESFRSLTNKQNEQQQQHHHIGSSCALALSINELLLELNGMNQLGPQAQRIPVYISKQRRQACRQLNRLYKGS